MRYPFDVTLCLCIPSYFERQNYFMMWLCTYVSCHTLNDKIILFINITFTVNQLFLWYTFYVTLYLCITSYFEPHYYFIFIIITLTAKSVFVISILRDCIYASRHTLNDKIISCLPVRISNAQFYTSTQNPPSLMGAFYIDK